MSKDESPDLTNYTHLFRNCLACFSPWAVHWHGDFPAYLVIVSVAVVFFIEFGSLNHALIQEL